ncbi:metallophosphoesterase [Shewanella polaris]|uniref:Metallophosphoesterase n=1 Tax=Shewanella polaris TaxID=2588449 RepID=A0A4Y5YBD1_9GAMM|nr:metallophosphoesterase [Shewanella polaris]QDE29816.1 metallophosphoesterase [Shewanella polaris]
MKILHLSDLHFIQKHFDWITQVQDDFDVICLTGDLLCDSNAQKVDKKYGHPL